MESLFHLAVASGAPVRILQITDTHLFAGQQETLLGVNTYRSYQAVLAAIRAEAHPFDLIVATGDLAQDHSAAAYQHFAAGVAALHRPCLWLPGNHDFQPAMVDALAQAGVHANKRALLGDRWQIVLLDSQVVGVPHGELSDYQLEWLEQTLASEPQRHTMLLLHHHPLPSGCTWLDQHSLRNAHALDEILRRYPQVNTLVCGHIHQELDLDWNGCRLLATPSTCVQFKPLCTNFTIDTISPGWRYLTLYPDGRVTTAVHRLASSEFRPDLDADGY
ncbi:3',5'-cyclic-AMP phosphodiesterase [Edwardsiella piscicida]|uniref:3',5'-cyclic adenosine monophosphate phosphodiesterase CpdA n=3 Tax=Edwardsiella TaxID=635 RepID=A0A0H3DMA0_EDWTF|nr:3',5'-cyclic-AMP phosphodiesterase [Edwardsiella piscicida]ACY83040.1 cyclic 3,5-adenosine monophosphate phosphodiesterase [Edwardsiella tarda EIB202]ADM40288.1 3,5-cyclic-nucleotide phosphodiesterase [Edwardsiella tarda FL6-60]AGH72296.1 3',5'-cyclic-nucleotide phosphodiesterase [Edwardsiella piscicida C07-087]ARD18119.1 phosphodiesterase [Edwardsiella piscicida]EKS7768020.1 3',5'-cyclic-AMP phosphodiesterase [Edwardsiella piscicida]